MRRAGDLTLLGHTLAVLAIAGSGLSSQATVPARGEPAPRRVVLGNVKDVNGRPWAGAQVVVVSRLHPPGTDFEDRLEMRSDERGRFRVELLDGRVYAAWAYEAAGATRWRVSELLDGITGARPILLAEGPWPRVRARLRLDGLAAWARDGEARLVARASEVSPEGPHAHLDLALPVSGSDLEIPGLPHRRLLVWLVNARGERVQIASLPLIPDRWGQQSDATVADDGSGRLVLPAPRPVLVRVLDGGDRPVAGARVHVRSGDVPLDAGGRPHPALATDQDGLALVTLPNRGPAANHHSILVESANAAAAWSGGVVGLADDRDGKLLLAAKRADVTLKLAPATALRGRLLVTAGQPAAASTLRLTLYNRGLTATLITDADGRFTVPWLDAKDSVGLEAHLSPGQRRQIETALATTLWPTATLVHFERPRDLGDVVLAAMPRLALRVSGGDERSPAGALLQISGMPGRAMAADSRGALDVLLRQIADAWVCAHWPGGFAVERFTMTDRPVTKLALSARPAAEVRGRVIDARGSPVASAWVFLGVTSDAAAPEDLKVFGSLLGRQAMTDAQGRFRLPALRPDTTYSLYVGKYVEGVWVQPAQPLRSVEVGASGLIGDIEIVF